MRAEPVHQQVVFEDVKMKTIGGHVKQPVHEAYHLGPPPVLPGPLSQFPEDNGGCNTLPEMAEATKEGKLDIYHVLHLTAIGHSGQNNSMKQTPQHRKGLGAREACKFGGQTRHDPLAIVSKPGQGIRHAARVVTISAYLSNSVSWSSPWYSLQLPSEYAALVVRSRRGLPSAAMAYQRMALHA